jgi:ABC-type multidrug transport system fused ATPase/permease subunit
VLDEATSNVDMKTDDFIQGVIRGRFRDTTVLTVAHRLNTVADYDSILVLKDGKVAEEGAPWELLEQKGLFFEMVQHSGKNSSLITQKIHAIKKNNY